MCILRRSPQIIASSLGAPIPCPFSHAAAPAVRYSHCLDVEGYGTTPGSNVWTFTCHPGDHDPAHQNQGWSVAPNGTKGDSIISQLSGLCLSAQGGLEAPGANVDLETCGSQSAGQIWVIGQDGTIRDASSGLCLDTNPPPLQPCAAAPVSGYPMCDTKLPFRQRAQDLVSRLPLQEKLAQFANGAGAAASLDISSYQWWSEALHGVGHSPGVNFGGTITCATSFPQVILTAAGFNASMFQAIGDAISTEGRAMLNSNQAGQTFWAPNVNVRADGRAVASTTSNVRFCAVVVVFRHFAILVGTKRVRNAHVVLS